MKVEEVKMSNSFKFNSQINLQISENGHIEIKKIMRILIVP